MHACELSCPFLMTPSSVTNRGYLLPCDVDNVSVRSGKVHSHRALASMFRLHQTCAGSGYTTLIAVMLMLNTVGCGSGGVRC